MTSTQAANTKTDSASTIGNSTALDTKRSDRETRSTSLDSIITTYKQYSNKKRPRPADDVDNENVEGSSDTNHDRVKSIMSKEIATETESAGILFTSSDQHTARSNDIGQHVAKYRRQGSNSSLSTMRRVHSTPDFLLLDRPASLSCDDDDDDDGHSYTSDCHENEYDQESFSTAGTFSSKTLSSDAHDSTDNLQQMFATTTNTTTANSMYHHTAQQLRDYKDDDNDGIMETQHDVPAMNTKNFPDYMSPHDIIRHAVRHNGFEPKELPALSLDGFFLEPTDEHMEAYDTTVLNAVHDQDIDALRTMLNQGKTLQCCNRFGESLIHMVCRRGFTEIAEFLIREAGVSVRVRDDCGRTPLHDACWAKTPACELVELLISEDPDLLLLGDKRGHAPFQYVRQEHYPQWRQFIHDRWVIFRPRPGARTIMTPLSA